MKLATEISKLAQERFERVMSTRDLFIEAFVAETGLHPTECEMHEHHSKDGCIRVHIVKRGTPCPDETVESVLKEKGKRAPNES
jgi:hypothetical protein